MRLAPLFLVFIAAAVQAQQPLRDLFSPNDFVPSGAVAVDTLYIGGTFTTVGPTTGQAAVLDPATGLPDLSQTRIDGRVYVILPDGAGGWYAGGEIDFAGGQTRINLVHVLADGSLDDDFAPDPRISGNPLVGRVESLTLSADEQTLYVGGRFDTIGGQTRIDLAAIDAQTGAVLPFRADLTPNLNFIDIQGLLHVPYADGSGAALYIGGEFSAVNGVPRVSIAAVDAETGAVLPWNPEAQTSTDFPAAGDFALGTPPGPGQPGTLYMLSNFDRIRGVTCIGGPVEITLADPQTGEGGAPTGFCGGTGGAMFVVAGDYLFVASDFANRGLIKRISRSTGQSTSFFGGAPYGMTANAGVEGLAFDPLGGSGGGVLYVNTGRDGNRPVGRGQVVIGVDALTAQRVGPEIPVANQRTGVAVLTIAVEPGGRLFAGGGDFASVGVGGDERRFLAGLDLTTGAAIPFGTDVVIFSSVNDVAVSPDEQTLYFTTFNGIGVADLATGEITTFPTGGAITDTPGTEALSDTTGGHVRRGARGGPVGTRADGRSLAPFSAPTRNRGAGDAARRGGQSRVRTNGSTLVVTDDRLYFYPGGGAAAYDRDTAALIWSVTVPSFQTDPRFFDALLVEAGPPGAAGDTLFLAGSILSAGGQQRDRFAALDAETGAVLDWNLNPTGPGNGTGTAIAALGPAADGTGGARVYVAGSGLFTIGGEPRRNIAAADRTTGDVLGWTSQTDRAGGPALAVQPGPAGGVAGGVVYTQGVALDAETGARIGDWDLEPVGSTSSGFGGGAFSTLVSERHERIILTGTFVNSQRGSGHAFVTALTPARPFAVAGEPGATEAPRTASLALAGPNPLRTHTALALSLPEAQAVEAALYDVLGRRVAVLHTGPLPAGVSRLDVDASTLPAGVYVVRVVGTSFTEALRLTVVR